MRYSEECHPASPFPAMTLPSFKNAVITRHPPKKKEGQRKWTLHPFPDKKPSDVTKINTLSDV